MSRDSLHINGDSLEKDIQENAARILQEPSRVSDIYQKVLDLAHAVDFRKESDTKKDAKVQWRSYIVIAIDQLIKITRAIHCDICAKNGTIYLYDGTMWMPAKDDELKKFLREVALKMEAPVMEAKYYKFQDDLYRQIIAAADVAVTDEDSSKVLINLKNGTFEVNEAGRKLRGFMKEDFLTYQLPFAYDASADCPLFKQFLARSLPDPDSQKVVAEYIGYVFAPFLKLEKVLFLYGEGANGKSVFFRIISALLGRENVSSYSLQNLTSNEGYFRAELQDKLLNYATEISGRIDTSIFKQLASGEPVEARFIYKRAFTLTRYARLMFNSNTLPRDTESTHAFFRRFIIVPFEVVIPEAEQDPDLADKIIENELPGVLNWALEGLDRLLTTKHFTHSDKVESAGRTFRRQSDCTVMFLEHEGMAPGIACKVSSSELYRKYVEFCHGERVNALYKQAFLKKLASLGYEKQHTRIGNIIYYESQ